MKIYIVVTDVVNDVTYYRKSVITRVVIRFYDMTLSTGKQRRRMIKRRKQFSWDDYLHICLFVLRLIVSVNNVSVMCGRSHLFLGID